MPNQNRPLFIATNGYVCALDPTTGAERWRSRLGRGQLVSLLFSEGRLFAGVGGHVYAIDPSNGNVLWDNGLPGTGFGAVILAREGVSSDQAVAIQAELDVQAARRASTD